MRECNDIKDLIVQRNIAPVTQKEEQDLLNHVKSCEKCRQFFYQIASFETLATTCYILKPRDDIRTSLRRIVRKRARLDQRNTFERIVAFFASRRAMYKIAAAVIFLLLFVLGTPHLKRSRNIMQNEFIISPIDTVSLNVINLNQIIQIVDSQKVGVTLHQDTMLAKILYTL